MEPDRGRPGESRVARRDDRSTTTMVVCDTVLLLACLGSVVWLVGSGRPTDVVLGVVGPIVVAVLARTYGHGAGGEAQDRLRTLGRSRRASSR